MMKKATLLGLCLLPCIYSNAAFFEESPNLGAREREELQRRIAEILGPDREKAESIFITYINIITPEDMKALIDKYSANVELQTELVYRCLILLVATPPAPHNINLFSYLLQYGAQLDFDAYYAQIYHFIQGIRDRYNSDEGKLLMQQHDEALKKFYNQDEKQRKPDTDLDQNERQEERQPLKKSLRLYQGSNKDYLSVQNVIIAALLVVVGRFAHKHWYQTERKNTS